MATLTITKNLGSHVLKSGAQVPGTIDFAAFPYTNIGIQGTQTKNLTIDQGEPTVNAGINGYYYVGNSSTSVQVFDYGIFVLTTAMRVSSGSDIVIENTGTLELNGFSTNQIGAISYNPSLPGGIIQLPSGQATSIFSYVTGVENGDYIDFLGVNADGFTTSGSGSNKQFTLTSGGVPFGTTSFTPFLNTGATGASNIEIVSHNSTGTIIEFVCFLAGTLIGTEAGQVAVEELKVGDKIVALRPDSGETELRELVWIGKQRAQVRQGLPLDQSGYPVRILKDAVAAGVPSQDLLVTSEHSLFFDGRLVPVRMLVNGSTIFYDQSITSYDFYHVETEIHSVIYANDVLTESYLDTGNRRNFNKSDAIVRFPVAAKEWAVDAAAPLATDEATVKPIWERLAQRAAAIAPDLAALSTSVITVDAELCVIVDGRTIRPTSVDDSHAYFVLPACSGRIVLQSRRMRPSAFKPWLDDRRPLGVAVERIQVSDPRAGGEWRDVPLDHPSLDDGWWNIEQTAEETWRWTDGEGHLTLGALTGVTILKLKLCAGSPYIGAQDAGLSGNMQIAVAA